MKLTLSEIADHVDGQAIGNTSCLISGVSEIQDSKKETITFLGNLAYKKYLLKTKAKAVFVTDIKLLEGRNGIIVKNPQLAMAKTLNLYFPSVNKGSTIHPSAVVNNKSKLSKNIGIGANAIIMSGTKIGEGSFIGENTVIGQNVVIGSNCYFNPNVTIYDNSIIGNNVIIHSGTVIGSDGFGYVTENNIHYKIPQTGNVIIEDDVEIGSNCSIDKATIGSTIIGRASKLDNLGQIAHNVKIGKGCLMAAQFGISGSTIIGDSCIFAGRVGVAGHLEIGPNSIFAAKSGVTKSLSGGKVYAGYPAREIREHNKRQAIFNKIGKLYNNLNKFEDFLSNK